MAKTPDRRSRGSWQDRSRRHGQGARRGARHPEGDRQGRAHFKLEPWDWDSMPNRCARPNTISTKTRSSPISNHNVLEKGVFYAANKLYGVRFKKRTDIPVYQPDVLVYEVVDKDGSPLGLMYFDYFKRDNKSGGAWMDNFVGQSKLLGHQAGDLQRRQFHQARAGTARADQLRRRDHDVPRVRPCAARPVRRPGIPHALAAPMWRAISWNFPRSSTSIGRSIPTVLKHYAVRYDTGAPMPRRWWTRSRRPPLSTRAMS